MIEEEKEKIVSIDGVDYRLDELSKEALAQVTNIKFVDMQLRQLNNEWAVADTARIGYTNALKAEVNKLNSSE